MVYTLDMDTYERYCRIRRLLADDHRGGRLLSSLLNFAVSYMHAVCELEHQSGIMREGEYEAAEISETLERLDALRTHAHDSLISTLQALTRYLVETHGVALEATLYNREPHHLLKGAENRAAIGDWAGELVDAIFRSRRR